jgi:predicted dehydrogenase
MTDKLRVGIAGYGIVGKRRRGVIDAHDNMSVVALCDQTFDKKHEVIDGIDHYHHFEDLADHDLDAMFVCLSNDVAARATIAALERDLHVFCEKPPGRDLTDIAAVIDVKKVHPGLKLKYGFNHRYHDSVRDALEIKKQNKMGAVINLRSVYGKSKFISFGADSDWRIKRESAGGGILLDQGIHMVDLLRLFAGEFEQIHSFIDNSYWNHDVEDNAYAIMRTADGKVAMLHSTATQWQHQFNLEITFEKGAIVLSGILSGSKSYGEETMTVLWASEDDQGDPKEYTTSYSEDNSWMLESAEFADAILNDKPIVNGSSSDALKTMQTVYRIYCADPEWRDMWGLSDQVPPKT